VLPFMYGEMCCTFEKSDYLNIYENYYYYFFYFIYTGGPPHLRVISSKTYSDYVKPRIIPSNTHNMIFA